jgi:pimeloyl-ACP methyl ester carboxylesterase
MQLAANGLSIEVDERGPVRGEAVLLIMGLGMQLVAWPDELVDDLAKRGFRVLRIDNRDAGLSSGFDHLGAPNLLAAGVRHTLRLPIAAPYTIADMAADALGVLDALGIERAHLVGASMGGMIAQHLAADHPQRVASLTLMMTTSGARSLPQPSLGVRTALIARPSGQDIDSLLRHYVKLMRLIGSPGYRPDERRLEERLRASLTRAYRPTGTQRQLLAVMADGNRSARVRRIDRPTAVIHGRDDPLIPVQAGRELAQLIAGAELDEIPGMGHDLPRELLPRFAATIAEVAQRANR